MEVDKHERIWMMCSAAFIVVAIGTLIASVVLHAAELPTPAERIDPTEVRQTAPFDQPGLHETDDGLELVYISQAWAWDPPLVTVPAGEEITIKATSVDVLHGMKITQTNVNVMMIPGQVSEVTVEFDEPGTYTLLCHEYCGIGHHQMGAEIVVE